jgi:hypothetical protein
MFARAALLRVTVGAVASVDLVAAFVFFTGFAVALVRSLVRVVFLERFGFFIRVPSFGTPLAIRVFREKASANLNGSLQSRQIKINPISAVVVLPK